MSPALPPHEDSELLARALARTAGCPPIEQIAAAALGELGADERDRVLAHAASCPACGAELALATSFAREPASATESAEVDRLVARLRGESVADLNGRVLEFRGRRPAARTSSMRWNRWAAAALLVVGVGFAYQVGRRALPPEVAGPGGDGVVRSAVLALESPVGEVAGVPTELAWAREEGAALYAVELLDVAGETLGAARVALPRLTLAPELRATLRPRARYAWRVTAFAADGRELARSAVTEFYILPSGD